MFNDYTIHITNERVKEEKALNQKDISKYIKHVILRLIGKDNQLLSYLLFIHTYMKKSKYCKIAILDAHGYDKNENWYYWNDQEYVPVQQWVNTNDGDYGILFLHVCNPGHYCIYSDKSLVVTPRTDLSLYRQLENKKIKVELYVPRRGFIDQLNIEAEFNRMCNKPFKTQIGYFYDHFEELWKL